MLRSMRHLFQSTVLDFTKNDTLQRCGGQDSNLRTDKEWDLNPPPLTKLGDPRTTWWQRMSDFKPPMGEAFLHNIDRPSSRFCHALAPTMACADANRFRRIRPVTRCGVSVKITRCVGRLAWRPRAWRRERDRCLERATAPAGSRRRTRHLAWKDGPCSNRPTRNLRQQTRRL